MPFAIYTHDAWGVVHVGDYATLEDARTVFSALREDPWYAQDGTVRGIELARINPQGQRERLDWFAIQPA